VSRGRWTAKIFGSGLLAGTLVVPGFLSKKDPNCQLLGGTESGPFDGKNAGSHQRSDLA
jgi:hypothetical protein